MPLGKWTSVLNSVRATQSGKDQATWRGLYFIRYLTMWDRRRAHKQTQAVREEGGSCCVFCGDVVSGC
jgi:hypothetical protein